LRWSWAVGGWISCSEHQGWSGFMEAVCYVTVIDITQCQVR